jgi:hypothetical protein
MKDIKKKITEHKLITKEADEGKLWSKYKKKIKENRQQLKC